MHLISDNGEHDTTDSEDSEEEDGQTLAATTSSQKETDGKCNSCQNNDKLLCKICLDCEIQILVLPCRHFSICYSCAARLHDCPICRTKIHAIVEVYIP